MSLLEPGQQNILLLIHIFILVSQARCHHQTTSLLTKGVRIIPFWTRQWQTLNKVWIQSSLTLLSHRNWMYHLRSLKVFLHQSQQSSYTQSVLFLILLNHSLPLASNLISYGARLEHYNCLYLCQARCQHLNWQHLGSSLLHHQIASLWILPIGRWIRVCLIFKLALVQLLMPLWIWSS